MVFVNNLLRKCGRSLVFLLPILLLVPFTVFSATGSPKIFSYQGRLTNSSGILLGGAGTNYYFRFSLWDNAGVGSGNKLWPAATPGVTTLSVVDGVFNAAIGDTTNGYPDALTYNFQDNSQTYLQVEVSTDGLSFETLGPRQAVNSSGFAINANTVSGLTPGTGADNILKLGGDGEITIGGTINSTSTATSTFSGAISALNISGTNTGDMSLAAAEGLSLVGQSLSLTNGYAIPLIASTTAWENKVSSQWLSDGLNLSYLLGNVAIANNLNATGTITASAFFGDGSGLTGLDKFSTSTTRGVFSASGPLSYDNFSGIFSFATSSLGLSTSDIAEGLNLYYTDTRARGALSSSVNGLVYNSGTGVLSLDAGYVVPLIASTTVWNNKQDTIATGTTAQYLRGDLSLANLDSAAVGLNNVANVAQVTSVSGTGAITSSGDTTTPTISVTSGYEIPLSASTTAWQNFLATPSGVISAGANLLWDGNTLNVSTSSLVLSTTNVNEGTNFYYTDARARGAMSVSVSGLTYNSGTGAIALDSGYAIPLSASTTEWSNKQNAITTGNTAQYFRGDLSLATLDSTAVGLSNVANVAQVTSVSGSGAISSSNGTTPTISVASGYEIPLAASTTVWQNFVSNTTPSFSGITVGSLSGLLFGTNGSVDTISTSSLGLLTTNVAEGSNLYYTDARARGAISSFATGLSYDSGAGTFSLTSGYGIPLSASSTAWQNFLTTPSGSIGSGAGLSWSGNTLNTVGLLATTSAASTYISYTGASSDVDLGSKTFVTTGTLGAGAVTGTSFAIGANTISSFANLSSIAGLSYGSPAFVKMTGANTFTLDTNTYLTSLAGALLADGTVAGATSQAQVFNYGVTLGGAANASQLIVKANASQTVANPLVVLQDSTGAELSRISTNATTSLFMGYSAGNAVTTGKDLVFIGGNSGVSNAGGSDNIAIGLEALRYNVSGANNVGIGTYALRAATGSSNVGLGSYSGSLVTGANNTFLGAYSGRYQVAISNKVIIDGLDRSTAAKELTDSLFVGNTNTSVGSQTARINANLGLGIDPTQRLSVYGSQSFSGMATAAAPTGVLAGVGAGNLGNGNYKYKVGFYNANGDATLSDPTSNIAVVDNTTNGQITVTFATSSDVGVTGRKIYRTAVGGSAYYLLATIANNSATTYTDNIADATLITQGSAPLFDTSAGWVLRNTTKTALFTPTVNWSSRLMLGDNAIQSFTGSYPLEINDYNGGSGFYQMRIQGRQAAASGGFLLMNDTGTYGDFKLFGSTYSASTKTTNSGSYYANSYAVSNYNGSNIHFGFGNFTSAFTMMGTSNSPLYRYGFGVVNPTDTLMFISGATRTITGDYNATTETAGNDMVLRGGGSTSGEFSTATIATAGTGYTVGDVLTVALPLDSNSRAVLTVSTVDGSGGVTGYTLGAKGAKYIVGQTYFASGGTGTGFSVTIASAWRATDKNGGNLYLYGGISSGTGSSNVYIGGSPAGSTGNGANASSNVLTVLGGGKVGAGTTIPLTTFQAGLDTVGSEAATLGSLTPIQTIFGAVNNTTESSLLRLIRPTNASNLYPASVDFKMKSYATAMGNPYLPKTQLTIALKASGSYDTGSVVDVLTLRDNGYVGIGTSTPGYTLTVAGKMSAPALTVNATGNAVCINATTGEFQNSGAGTCTVSSERFKHNIETLNEGLSFVNKLRPVSFVLNETGESSLGFIAEEVNKLDSRLVFYDVGSTSTPRGVRYENITAVLAKAIQELSAKVDAIGTSTLSAQDLGAGTSVTEWIGSKITAVAGFFESLTVGSPTKPTGITVYDKNGQAGCLSVDDVNSGAMKVVSGACDKKDVPTSGTVGQVMGTTTPGTTIPVTGTSTDVVGTGTSTPDVIVATSTEPVSTPPVTEVPPQVPPPTPTPVEVPVVNPVVPEPTPSPVVTEPAPVAEVTATEVPAATQ